MLQRLPIFSGLAQKGGTTTLQRLLEQHPPVSTAVQGLHYFSLHYGEGEAWYQQQFSGGLHQRCGEIMPITCSTPKPPRASMPCCRRWLILLLRIRWEFFLSGPFHAVGAGTRELVAAWPRPSGCKGLSRALPMVSSSHQEQLSGPQPL